ncbi:MAG: hypothetical protein ACT4UQ_01410 [Gammaproteobacteria bacterium]
MTGRLSGSSLMAVTAWLLVGLSLPAIAAPQYGQPAPPQDQSREVKKPSKKSKSKDQEEVAQPGPQYSKEFKKAAQEASKLANDKKWAEVLAALPALEAMPALGTDEKKAIATWRLQATQAIGEPEAFAAAIEAFLNEGYADQTQLGPMHRQLAAHYNTKKDRPKAAEHFQKFVDHSTDVEPDEYETLGRLHRLNSNYADCARWLGKSIELTASRKETPKEDLFGIRDDCLYRIKDNAGRIDNLEQLLAHYPDKKYYSNLMNLLRTASQDDRLVMLNAYRLAVTDPRGGLAIVGDYYNYSDLARNSGSSGEAVRALERGMKDAVVPSVGTNQQALQDAKAEVRADQKTLAAEAAAAEASAKGEIAVKVGLGFYSAGEYARAADLVRKGIAKGNVARLDDANLLLGAALLQAGRKDEARAAFEAAKAAAGDGHLARIARMWLANTSRDDSATAQATPPDG